MSKLCNHCECVNINGVRCHETGCPNKNERISLIDDGTLDTVFKCGECGEEMRFMFDPEELLELLDPEDPAKVYDDFVYRSLRTCQDEHVCKNENEDEAGPEAETGPTLHTYRVVFHVDATDVNAADTWRKTALALLDQHQTELKPDLETDKGSYCSGHVFVGEENA
jgi:hypothetical protein